MSVLRIEIDDDLWMETKKDFLGSCDDFDNILLDLCRLSNYDKLHQYVILIFPNTLNFGEINFITNKNNIDVLFLSGINKSTGKFMISFSNNFINLIKKKT